MNVYVSARVENLINIAAVTYLGNGNPSDGWNILDDAIGTAWCDTCCRYRAYDDVDRNGNTERSTCNECEVY
jgi:hypothetical protein